MRPSEGPSSIDFPVRAFSYDSGASGPELTRAVAVEAPVQIVIGGRALRGHDGDAAGPGGFRLRLCADRADRREGQGHSWRRGRASRRRMEAQDRALRGALAGASGARPGDERTHRMRPLRDRGFLPDALAPSPAASAGPDRARGDPRRPQPNSRRASLSIRRPEPSMLRHGAGETGRSSWFARTSAGTMRSTRRSGRSRAPAWRRTAASLSSPAAARSKWWRKRRSSAPEPSCRFRRRPRSRSSAPSVSAFALIAVARRDQALCFEGGTEKASGGLAA